MLQNKSGNISETRKDRGKVTMDGLQKLTNALSNGTIPDPLRPPLPQNWGVCNLATPLISGTGKATDFKFGGYNYMANRNKSPLKILEKRERGRTQGLPTFFGYPLLSQERVKLRTSNLAGIFTRPIQVKARSKFRRRWSVGVSRDCPNFLGTP